MKRIGLALLAILTLALCACGKLENVTNEYADARKYELEFENLVSKKEHSFALEQGDALYVRVICTKGEIRLRIEGEDGEEIYAGNLDFSTAFFVTVLQTGDYRVMVEGRSAQGSVTVSLEEE